MLRRPPTTIKLTPDEIKDTLNEKVQHSDEKPANETVREETITRELKQRADISITTNSR